jgi:uncharacterized membrane protein YhhN
MLAFACVTLTWVAVMGLLAAEYAGSRTGVWIAKPLAASGFVATALVSGASATAYGAWILIGLALSFLGDLLLIPRGAKVAFAAGLASFLLAHMAYGVAFVRRGVEPWSLAIAAAVLIVPAIAVLRWLGPNLRKLRVPVYAYVTVISAMVALAVATVAARGAPSILVGALMFYCSDLAVARERFVAHGFVNKAWGLPLYFGGQIVLALSVNR